MPATRSRFINRELSWLDFNRRVLAEARNPAVPLLERLKFLAITGSNLDEFFMVRVGGLELLNDAGVRTRDPAGLTPSAQLAAVARQARRMVEEQYCCLLGELQPALARHGFRRIPVAGLTEAQREYLHEHFTQETLPVLTPTRIEGPEFPALTNLAIHLAVRLGPARGTRTARYAVIPLARNLERFVPLPAEQGFAYVPIEEVIKLFVADFFPGVVVREAAVFRITRNADLGVREDDAADFMAEMEEVLLARKQSDCVRLEVEAACSHRLRGWLQQNLRVPARGIFVLPGPAALGDHMKLASLQGFDNLRYEPWPPQPTPAVDARAGMFETLSRRSLLLLHPYESFDPVVRFVQEAARDPQVLAIKQVLYRMSPDSAIAAALKEAAERGKHVTALIELRARFDEARNIERARMLEQAGVQVIYGLRGLKTHAKVCLVVRRESSGMVRYTHFGTGNYNERTARLYSDVSYLTADEDLGRDASAFFNAVSGYSEPQPFRKLEMSPTGMIERVIELIDGEALRKREGQQALILAKMNSLVDPDVIAALYRASRAGVPIRLNVRGVCCLRPGVPGLSPTIEVTSILDRYLEHSRIFYFLQGGEPKLFISSADWMPRNLRRRVELMVPVDDEPSKRRLLGALETYFRDTLKSWRLLPDGRYARVSEGARRRIRSQELLYREAVERVREARKARRRTFEPYTAPQPGM